MMPTDPPIRVLPATPFGSREPGTPPPPATRITRIGEYDLLYRLGTGGMGNVYLARRRNESGLQRLFAVKAMHAVLSADSEFANMFLDEAHIASQLHHINVVGIVDLGRYAGRLFLVMDYVEGPTLAQLLAAATERPPGLICAIVIDMLHGLHAAHRLTNEAGERLELVHRDVSPSNILIGTDGVARLTDFGIAKARMRRTSTSPGVRKGKLSYSAPEQITNPGGEDARVDVFAAGVVLWNALTGSRLFDGDNEASVILSVINRPIPPPSALGLRPPAYLDEVCMRALSRNPAGRYPSAAEMADDLRRVTREHDIVVGPEQVAAWVSKAFGDELAHRRAAIRASAGMSDSAGIARGTGAQVPEYEADYEEISVSARGGTVARGVAGTVGARRDRRAMAVKLGLLMICVGGVVGALWAYPRVAGEATTASAPAPEAEVVESAPALAIPARSEEVPPLDPKTVATEATTETTTETTTASATDAMAQEAAEPASLSASPASPASLEEEDDAKDDPPSAKAHRRRKPAAAAQRRRSTPSRAEPDESAPPAAQPAPPELPAPPPPSQSIESNPYLRRGSSRR